MKILPLALMLLSSTLVPLATAQSQNSLPLPVAGVNRPADVPNGYLITPFGYYHPSCVKEVATGDVLQADGRVLHNDGTLAQKAATCAYKSFPVGPRQKNPAVNGWVEDIDAVTGTAYGELTSSWTVPPAPKNNDGQTIYFFPGFQTLDSNPQYSILQPVLGWYNNYWTIASWNCCISGSVYHSGAVIVHPGDQLSGLIESNCAAGNTYCATWKISSIDTTTGRATTLNAARAEGQVWNWTFGAVLEAYGVLRCTDYPNTANINFTTTVYDDNFNVISNPGWYAELDNSNRPSCNYNQTIQSNTQLELSF